MKLICNLEVLEQILIEILSCKTSICKVAINMYPFLEASIIEHLEFVCDDKRDDTICKTFLEHYQASNSAITVLERMYLLNQQEYSKSYPSEKHLLSFPEHNSCELYVQKYHISLRTE